MTLTTQTLKDIYTGDNVVSVFAFTFKIFVDTDLKVTEVLISTGAKTLLTITTDYTVSGAGDASGGNVTLVAGALADTKQLVIQRNQTLDQQLDLEENDPQPSANVETQFDKGVAMIQQVQEQLDRAILQPITETTTIAFPSPSASKAIAWDSTGTVLENIAILSQTDVDAAAASAAAAASSASDSASSASSASSSAGNASVSEANAAASAAGVNLPDITSGDATKQLRVNAGETGYELFTGLSTPLVLTAALSSNEVPLTVTQNDTTNNPVATVINNAGDEKALDINQIGVSGASSFALDINSTAAQPNSGALNIEYSNVSTTATLASITNAGTGITLSLVVNGVLAGGKHGLIITSDQAHVNADSALVLINQDNASASEPALEILNDGSGVQIQGEGNENLAANGVWTDRTSTLADKDIIAEIISPEFADKLKTLKLYSYQKKCEVYGNKKKDLEEIDESEYDKDNSSHKKKGNKFYKKVGDKKYPTQKKNPQSRIYKGYILDDPTTPEELVSLNQQGEINGVSAADGVNFLLGACKELLKRIEVLETP